MHVSEGRPTCCSHTCRQGDTARHTAEPMEGSPEDLAATLVEYGAAGADHVQLVLDPITMDSVELAGEALSLVR